MSNKLVILIQFLTQIGFIFIIIKFKIKDEYIWELVAQENYKQLTDLVILGFDDLLQIIEAKYGNADHMRDNGMKNQADQIYTILPQIQVI